MRIFTANLKDTDRYFQGNFFIVHDWGPEFRPDYDQYYKDLITGRIVTILKKNSRNVVVADYPARDSGLEGQQVNTENTPVPPVLSSHVWDRKTTSNKPFLKKKRAGEIVLAPMHATSVTVTSYPGFHKEWFSPYATTVSLETDSMFKQVGLTQGEMWGRPIFYISDKIACFWPVMQYVYDIAEGYYVEAFPLHADQVAKDLINSREVDVGVVTHVVAEANKQTLDALTAVAEMPETVRSMIGLTKTVARILSGVKKREFSLTQAFEKRKASLRSKRDLEMQRYTNRLNESRQFAEKFSARSRNRKLAKIARRDRDRALRTYDRAMKESLVEFNDAMASTWMRARYEIMPNVYLAIDITEVLKQNPQFLTSRAGFKQSGRVLPKYGEFKEVPVETQGLVFVRTKVENTTGPFSFTSNRVSMNILTTAWELLSKSFVVDWFINIGDFITAISGGGDYVRGNSISFKELVNFSDEDDEGRKLVIEARCYDYSLFSENQYTCLRIEPDMNPLRYTDSVAMLWSANRETLMRSIRSGSKSRRTPNA